MLPLKAIISFCCLALTVYLQVSAQTSNDPVNARYAGMADAGVVVPDVWSGFHNQAGLAYISGLSLSVHYESRFCIPENSIKALTIGIPVLKGTLGLNYSMFGYAKYFESRTGLAYGRMLGKRFAAGIQINHLMIRQSADYGNMHTVIPEGGFLAQPLDDLYIGFHIFNPAQQHFPQCHDQAIPSLLQIGIGYRIIDNVFLSAEVEKETDKKQVIKVGVEYEMIRHFNLRLGVSTASTYRYALGIGYVYRRINLDFALSHHQWLGFTPYITLGYSVNNEK